MSRRIDVMSRASDLGMDVSEYVNDLGQTVVEIEYPLSERAEFTAAYRNISDCWRACQAWLDSRESAPEGGEDD